MKTTPTILFAIAVALGTTVAFAQDAQTPAPPAPAPAPNAANQTPAPTPPGHDGWRGERRGDHRDGGPRSPEGDRPGETPFHAEGDRRSEGWRREGPMHMPMPPVPTKPTSYIGVVTSPLPAVLTAQLGLADGFGLVVGEVLPDSPAAKAGLQRYDVLTKFNDQQLVDSSQFSTLVRAQKKDTEATLTFLRKAQEQKATVKIDEKLLPVPHHFPGFGGSPGSTLFLHRDSDGAHGAGPENGRRMQDRMRGFGDKMREFQERMKAWQKNPSADVPQPPEMPSLESDQPIPPEEILREVQPGGVAQIRLLQPDGKVTYNTANAKIFVRDESGEIEITGNDGKRSLVARNAAGETVFDGPIDTEEQRKALPEDIRKKIEVIEVQTKLAQAQGEAFVDSALDPDVQ